MKLTALREDLLAPLLAVMPAITTKGTMPILNNVLLNASAGLFFTGTNLDTQITCRAGIDLSANGAITIPARKLLDIVRLAPEGATITMDQAGEKLKVKAGPSRYTLATLPAENFPAFNAGDILQTVELPANDLLRGLRKVAYCMAVQDVRYYLNGAAIKLTHDTLETVASDGHRLAMMKTQLTVSPDTVLCGEAALKIVPRDSVLAIIKFLAEAMKSNSGQVVKLRIGTNTASVTLMADDGEGPQFSTRLVEGKYPHVERVIPKETTTHFRIGTADLTAAIQRAGVVSEKQNQISMDIDSESIVIKSANPEGDDAEESLRIELDGMPLSLGFNGQYLLDAINVIDADTAEFKLQANSGLVLDPDESGWLSVVMPMRL